MHHPRAPASARTWPAGSAASPLMRSRYSFRQRRAEMEAVSLLSAASSCACASSGASGATPAASAAAACVRGARGGRRGGGRRRDGQQARRAAGGQAAAGSAVLRLLAAPGSGSPAWAAAARAAPPGAPPAACRRPARRPGGCPPGPGAQTWRGPAEALHHRQCHLQGKQGEQGEQGRCVMRPRLRAPPLQACWGTAPHSRLGTPAQPAPRACSTAATHLAGAAGRPCPEPAA